MPARRPPPSGGLSTSFVLQGPPPQAQRTPAYMRCGDFVLRTLRPEDVTPAYVDWFNSDYVQRGLNLKRRAFTREEHLQHIAAVARGPSDLLIAQEARGGVVLSYFKVDIDPGRSLATFTLALDRSYANARQLLSEVMWHAVRHYINQRRIHKVKLEINRSNIAARRYIGPSAFKLEGTLRDEAILHDGRRDDILVYGILAGDLVDRWGKKSPYAYPPASKPAERP